VSEEKFSKCEEGGKKYKCGISGVRKKRIERKVPERKNQSVLGENFKLRFLLQSKVKVWRKKMFGSLVTFSWALC
jgi:hypothetical protein